MNPSDIHQFRRQSPVSILLILLKFFQALLRQAWPLLIIYFLGSKNRFESIILTVGIFAGVGSTIYSIIAYFNFYYAIKGEELHIHSGLLNKTRLNIPFDRIQAINLVQNPIHRFFGVVGLKIDTAGSTQQEADISALSRAEAEMIQEIIFGHKKDEVADTEEADIPVADRQQKIFQLDLHTLIRTGLTQNHLKAFGIVIATLFGFYQFGEDIMGEKQMSTLLKNFFGDNPKNILGVFLQWLPLLLLISVVISVGNVVLRYFNLILLKTANGFKSIAGLFTRHEQSASLGKIQFIEWDRNFLMKWLGLFSLSLKPATSGRTRQQQTIFVPGCGQNQIDELKNAYFGPIDQWPAEVHPISSLIILRRTLYFGLLPALFLMLISYNAGAKALIWLLLIPLSYWVNYRYHKKWKFYVNELGIQTNKGVLSDRSSLLKWHKIQSVALRQSIYQRRKNLADIYLYTAAGTIQIPFVELEKARKLQNFALYKIASSQEAWM
ncbi:MAG: PH domain-containing protein [Bacteroidota bacterium]